jgi:hypothetical protein
MILKSRSVFLLASLLLLSACNQGTVPDQLPTGLDTPLPSTTAAPRTQPTPTFFKPGAVTPDREGEVYTEVGEHFYLVVGQTAVVSLEKLTITLKAITEDSRCPKNVQCFHAGWVTVEVSVQKDGESIGDFELTLGAALESQSPEASFEGLVIRLLEVNPYPQDPGAIEQGDYVVRLVVE